MPGVNSFGHLRACRTSPEALLQSGVISPWGTLLQNSSASLSASSRSHPPGHPQLPAPSLGHTEFLEKCCDQARNQVPGVRATPLLLRVLIAAISKGSSGASMLRLQRFPANLLPLAVVTDQVASARPLDLLCPLPHCSETHLPPHLLNTGPAQGFVCKK